MKRETLERYPMIKMEVEHQLERIIRAKNKTELPARMNQDNIRKQPTGSDRLSNIVANWLDLEARLLPSIEEAIDEMTEIESAVDRLGPFESEVLRLRYLDGEHGRFVPWKEVAARLYGDNDEKEMQATYRLHRKALKEFETL